MKCSGCGKDHETLGAFRVGKCNHCGEPSIMCSNCEDAHDVIFNYKTIKCAKHYPDSLREVVQT